MNTITILVADDHPMVAESLSEMLNTVPGFEVLGTVSNGWQALNFLEENEVDVLLTDLNMPLLNGIELAKMLLEKKSRTKVLLLTMSNEPELIENDLSSGIHGYLLKSAEKWELVEEIRMVGGILKK